MAISREELNEPSSTIHITNNDLLSGPRIEPKLVVGTYSADQFENFIGEWAYSYLTKRLKKYEHIYKLGGAGDKGRDILCFVSQDDNIADYYQCKHYNRSLNVNDILGEIGKICYHSFTGEIPYPRKCYFVAPKDGTPQLIDFLQKNSNEILSELRRRWNEKFCRDKITKDKQVLIEGEFEKYLESLNLTVFALKPIHEILDEFQSTEYWSTRFGLKHSGTAKVVETPKEIQDNENVYVQNILDAYTQSLGQTNLKRVDLKKFSGKEEHFNRQRDTFYSAEALRVYDRETFPVDYNEFEKVKEHIKEAIYDMTLEEVDPFEKMNKVTMEATKIQTTSSLLNNVMDSKMRKGICHHLSNDQAISWINKDKNEEY